MQINDSLICLVRLKLTTQTTPLSHDGGRSYGLVHLIKERVLIYNIMPQQRLRSSAACMHGI